MGRPSVKDEWEDIYKSGRQINRYPFDKVISFMFKYAPKDMARSSVKFLEMGCGASNNLLAAAKEGFRVYGFDFSEEAISISKERFKEENLECVLDVADFSRMPYEDSTFHMAVARASLSCVSLDGIKQALSELRRVLVPKGVFFLDLYSDRHTSSLSENLGETYIEPTRGALVSNGKISFLSRNQVLELMKPFEILSFTHMEEESVLDGGAERDASWNVIGRKND